MGSREARCREGLCRREVGDICFELEERNSDRVEFQLHPAERFGAQGLAVLAFNRSSLALTKQRMSRSSPCRAMARRCGLASYSLVGSSLVGYGPVGFGMGLFNLRKRLKCSRALEEMGCGEREWAHLHQDSLAK